MTNDTLTMAEARAAYFQLNQFGEDGGYGDRWVKVKVGPIPLWFPNTPARVRAVRFHDLHHVLTGYQTNFTGECEIAAWEIATGCGRHTAAWGLNLTGLGAGLFCAPRAVFRAFVRGRHTENLYHRPWDDALLRRSVEGLARELKLDAPAPAATGRDVAAFVAWAIPGLAALLLTSVAFLAPPAALAAALWALLHR